MSRGAVSVVWRVVYDDDGAPEGGPDGVIAESSRKSTLSGVEEFGAGVS
jgi:hypothetical protein